MKAEYFTFPSSNKKQNISAVIWEPDNGGEPEGVVQICHGMYEHAGRYEDFARFMTDAGYAVCINDHLGHGDSTYGVKGYFGRTGGYKYLVKDTHRLFLIAKNRYNNLPYIMLGHSMGSFVARLHCAKYANGPDGLILSGTGQSQRAVDMGIAVSKLMVTLNMGKAEGLILNKMSNSIYNKRIPDARTNVDWLSRDEETVTKFLNDPKTRFVFTYSAFLDLFTMLKLVSSDSWAAKIPKELPIYIFSGEEDPVGEYGDGVKDVYNCLIESSHVNVAFRLYPDGRHEMLNEINREQVYRDVLDWISGVAKRKQNIEKENV